MTEPTFAQSNTANPAEKPMFPPINQALLVVSMAIVALLAVAGIRTLALRVTQYQVSVYEDYVRDALAKGDFTRAVEITTGAIKSSVNRSDHWGRAWLLRAVAELKLNQPEEALADLERSGAFFHERYYFAEEQDNAELAATGTELGKRFLQEGKTQEARRALSMAATGSGQPVEYLKRLNESMNEESRAKLWPEGTPSITLRSFRGNPEAKMEEVVEQQGRKLVFTGVDPAAGESLALEVAPATQDGRSVYACDTWMPLTESPFSLRLVARSDGGSMPGAFVGLWFDSARQSAHVNAAEWTEGTDGWLTCTLPLNFLDGVKQQGKERGFSPHDGIINRVGFEFNRDSANKVWLERVELLLP